MKKNKTLETQSLKLRFNSYVLIDGKRNDLGAGAPSAPIERILLPSPLAPHPASRESSRRVP